MTEKTSRIGLEQELWSELVVEFELDQTGWELGRGYQVIVMDLSSESVEIQTPETAEAGSGLASQAAAFALAAPQVESTALPPPRLSGNLAEDVHDVCGLTWEQIAQVFKVSERAAAGWRTQGVPSHRQEVMEALRAIGVTLVGGLGAEGVAYWLTVGSPSRLERLRAGNVGAVAEEARAYLDGPAT
jgi:hypothetical protein